MLTLQGINKSFDRISVLHQLNWEIGDNRIIGLVGSNGSGKSTLLRCISGVYTPDSGSILYDGESVEKHRQDMFFVSDEPFYVNRFTTKEMKNFYRSFYQRFDDEKYNHLIQSFDFDDTKPIPQLSKGLKRQSALILALSCRPKLLLLDESFDGLDPRMRLQLKREMIANVEEGDFSVIISSHNIRELEDICDGMSLLENRQIVFTRTLEQLNTEYHKMQIGYDQAPPMEALAHMPFLSMEALNRVVTVTYRGKDVEAQIAQTQPVLMNPLPISMEEIFVVEMEAKHEK